MIEKEDGMTKYKYGNPEAPIVLIQPVGDHDLPEIEGEVAQIRKLTALDFQMIAVKVDDWNLDLSPWRSPAAFRSGLEAVEPIQNESAISLGMNSGQVLRYVILPQAMSTSIPAFVANIIFLLKETSVFSAISLMDLMFTAKDLIGLYYKTTESLFLLVVFYLLILLPVSIVGSLVERRMRYAGFGD